MSDRHDIILTAQPDRPIYEGYRLSCTCGAKFQHSILPHDILNDIERYHGSMDHVEQPASPGVVRDEGRGQGIDESSYRPSGSELIMRSAPPATIAEKIAAYNEAHEFEVAVRTQPRMFEDLVDRRNPEIVIHHSGRMTPEQLARYNIDMRAGHE